MAMAQPSDQRRNQQCTLTAAETAQPIINTILSDINAIMPNFSSLVSSYRLLVGASEEIHRMADICPDVWERAVRRFDNAGTLIDILLDLLCCKISYSSEFLEISCLPVDLFRLLANRTEPCDQSHRTAEQIIVLEALREMLANCNHFKCFPNTPVVCPIPPTSAATAPPSTALAVTQASMPPTAIRSGDSVDFTPQALNLQSEPSKQQPPEEQSANNTFTNPPLESSREDTSSPSEQPSIESSKASPSDFDSREAPQSSVRRRHI